MIKVMLCEDGDLSDLKRQGYAAEWKHDGTRVLVVKENGQVALQNRHGINYTRRLPEVVEAAKEIPVDSFVIDGEAVYINPQTGKEEFTPCQCSVKERQKEMLNPRLDKNSLSKTQVFYYIQSVRPSLHLS